MRRIARHILVLLAVLCLSGPAMAQEDDKGYLTRTLEDLLSAGGYQVRIEGFRGALNSRAELDTLTIADDDGIWLTLSTVSLDWTRSALLNGRVEVNALTAEKIDFARRPSPVAGADGPKAEASGFKLPELPVSVEIGKISADEVTLGETVIGVAASLSLDGAMSLVENRALAKLEIARLDGPEGQFTLETDFDGTVETLMLRLALKEAPDGLAANLLDLPGRPAVEMTLAGDGPLANFTADFALATDGTDRLTGRFALTEPVDEIAPETEQPRRFSADLSGDVTALVAPEFRPFFGSDVRLRTQGARAPDGRLTLDELEIDAAKISLSGAAELAPDGFPEAFSIQAVLADPDGGAVRLPVGTPEIHVRRAVLLLEFDAAAGSGWEGSFAARNLVREGLSVNRFRLDASGDITRREGAAALRGVTAALDMVTEGLVLDDPALAQALGHRAEGAARLTWREGAPLTLSSVRLSGPSYRAALYGNLSDLAAGIAARGSIRAELTDLAALSGLAGRPLGGTAALRLDGDATLLAGFFDLSVAGTTDGLSLGHALLDPLLGGAGKLTLQATRDDTGIRLQDAHLTTPGLAATASGELNTGATALTIDARVVDMARLTPTLRGALSVAGTLRQRGDRLDVDARAVGPGGSTARLGGSVPAADGPMDLTATGRIPLALADRLAAAAETRLRGTAEFDLALEGPPDLAGLSGTVSTSGAQAFIPAARLSLEGIEARAAISGGTAQLQATSGIAGGGRAEMQGQVEIAPGRGFPAALSLTLRDLVRRQRGLYDTIMDGDLTISGPLTGGALISGDLRLGETELRVPSSTLSSAPEIPLITHINDPASVRATRRRAGLDRTAQMAGGSGTGPGLDVRVLAPRRVFLRGRGLDAELGGEMRLRGTTANIIPSGQFQLIRGRLDFLTKRLTLTEGNATLAGRFVPTVHIVAEATADDGTRIFVIVDGPAESPEISFSSDPDLPEDEILARLIFGRGVTQLSALQAAELAGAVAQLAGRGGGGLLGQLRQATGLDDLDIRTDDEGGTTARAGKYVSENVYTDIELGEDGKTSVTINLDVTPNLKARGRFGSDNDSGVGLFFERDY